MLYTYTSIHSIRISPSVGDIVKQVKKVAVGSDLLRGVLKRPGINEGRNTTAGSSFLMHAVLLKSKSAKTVDG